MVSSEPPLKKWIEKISRSELTDSDDTIKIKGYTFLERSEGKAGSAGLTW